jgi:septal ring factor EnvC (AmiA/AmiB activator)
VVAQEALTMDDYKLLISLGSTLASLAGAFAVVRYQVKAIMDTLQDVEKRLRVMDSRIDKAELTDQKVSVLAGMLSPSERDKAAREIACMLADISYLKAEAARMNKLHNGSHPPVASERKAT